MPANPITPTAHEDAERVARMFHEAYERLAPQFSYSTRKASAVPWENVPENNRKLMVATVGEVLSAIADRLEAQPVSEAMTATNSGEDALVRIPVRDIAFAAIQRCRKAGESDEMLARWISEDVKRAAIEATHWMPLPPPPKQID